MNAVVDRILSLPVIGILRGFDAAQIRGIIPAVRRGGLVNLEITMNSPGAAELIRIAVEMADDQLNIGAGTVTSIALLESALAAGARFIVTPAVAPEVMNACRERKVPFFPGALSPTEVVQAWESGAVMVKIFPAELGGPAFIRALKGPLPGIKLLPTGGVDLKTLPHFRAAGADGVGVGSPLFRRERIEAGDWPWLEAQTRAFIEAYHANP